MLVMRIVNVNVRVILPLMGMTVAVILGQVEPNARRHQ